MFQPVLFPPPFYRKPSFPHLLLSILLSPHTTILCNHPRRRSHGCKAPWYSTITPFCDPRYVSFTTPYTQCLCVPFGDPHAVLFRSSPRTSALAVGERETALGSPPCGHRAHTYTHTPFFPGFPFGHRTPVPAAGSPGRRGFENHRPKTDHTYKTSPFSLFLRVLCTPNIRHTYVPSLSPLAITIALYSSYTGLRLRLSDLPFPTSWCTELWNPAAEFPGFTLLRFGELTIIR